MYQDFRSNWAEYLRWSGYALFAFSTFLCIPDGLADAAGASRVIYGWQLFLLSYSMAYDAAVRGQYKGTEAVLFVGSAYLNTMILLSLFYQYMPFKNVARACI